jgi:flagella basal body P-ring formation protein FlgA
VKRLAEERGFRAGIEGEAGGGRADVVLRKESVSVGVEISITTEVEHETENLRKCLGAEFTHVLFVSTDARRRKEISKRFAGSVPAVSVCGPEEVVAMLDALDPGPVTSETTVRGYKVKLTRQTMTPEEIASRRSAVASVIAKSLGKGKK